MAKQKKLTGGAEAEKFTGDGKSRGGAPRPEKTNGENPGKAVFMADSKKINIHTAEEVEKFLEDGKIRGAVRSALCGDKYQIFDEVLNETALKYWRGEYGKTCAGKAGRGKPALTLETWAYWTARSIRANLLKKLYGIGKKDRDGNPAPRIDFYPGGGDKYECNGRGHHNPLMIYQARGYDEAEREEARFVIYGTLEALRKTGISERNLCLFEDYVINGMDAALLAGEYGVRVNQVSLCKNRILPKFREIARRLGAA